MQSVDFCHEGLLMSREFLAGKITFLSLGENRPLDHLVPSYQICADSCSGIQIDN